MVFFDMVEYIYFIISGLDSREKYFLLLKILLLLLPETIIFLFHVWNKKAIAAKFLAE